MMEERTKEAIRYLGYGRHAADARTLSLIQDAFQELDRCARPKSVYHIFELQFLSETENGGTDEEQSRSESAQIRIGNMTVRSRSLGRNLKGCRRAAVFGATLGTEVDYLLKRYSISDMSRVVVLQACAAAWLEEYCDDLQEQIGKEVLAEGCWLRPRFSPGYGDFDIHHQEEILRMLDTAKKIGLTMTESFMLTPTKSVTALIGISDTRENCHRKGCEVCTKTDCIYRRN